MKPLTAPFERAKIVSPAETAHLANSKWQIFQIGAGGTGSHLVQHIARLMGSNEIIADRIGRYTVIDGDRVEDRNVGRQLFAWRDVGQYKAEVLATRYSRSFGLSLGFANQYLKAGFVGSLIPKGSLREPTLIIGAVDQAAPRRMIFEEIQKVQGARRTIWWMDAGNGLDTGQVVFGNTSNPDLINTGLGEQFIEYLPYPAVVFPELINEVLDKNEDTLPCAEAVERAAQGPNINAQMGLILSEMLRVFLLGELRWAVVTIDYTRLNLGCWEITDSWLNHVIALIAQKETRPVSD